MHSRRNRHALYRFELSDQPINQSPHWYQPNLAQICHSLQISIAKQQQIDHDKLLIACTHTKISYALHMSKVTFFLQICQNLIRASVAYSVRMRIERAPRVKCNASFDILYCMSASLFGAHRLTKIHARARVIPPYWMKKIDLSRIRTCNRVKYQSLPMPMY